MPEFPLNAAGRNAAREADEAERIRLASLPNCAHCWRRTRDDGNPLRLTEIGGELICRLCINQNFFNCHDCNERSRWRDSETISVGGRRGYGDSYTVCSTCFESYSRCTECDEAYDPEAFEQCCTPRFAPTPTSLTPHLFPHCGCRDEVTCAENARHGNQPYAMRTNAARINSYSYRPDLVFKGDGPLYLGMEVELTASDPTRTAAEAVALLGTHVYIKSDASISRGFELVTHPMDFDWAMNGFPWNGWEILRNRGIGADDTTGIHIHVNRDGFSSTAHDFRWLVFFYRNQRMVEKVARRAGNYFAQFGESERRLIVPNSKTGSARCGKCQQCKRSRSSYCDYSLRRYAAINLSNSATYECRVFASTTNPVLIKGALALVAGSVEYTRQLTANDVLKRDGWSWGAFTQWITDTDAGSKFTPLLDAIDAIDNN